MKNQKVRLLTYMAFYAALYVVLKWIGDLIPFLQMPQGGSIQIELIALFIASYHLGWDKGILVGLLCWLLTFIMGSGRWFVNIMQYALDYFIPLIVVGAASIYWQKGKYNVYICITIAMLLRFMSNVLSGVYYWPPEEAAAGSMPAWIYSLSYNSGYTIATYILCILIVPVLINALKKTSVEFKVK